MASKPTDIDALTITIDADGTATLSGINYQDLRSLLTAASLYRYESKPKATPLDGRMDDVIHANNLEEFRWYHEQRLYIDVLDAKMQAAISPGSQSKDVARIQFLHDLDMRKLEREVRDAERAAAAAQAAKQPDHVALASEAVAKALRDADRALAALNRANADAKRAAKARERNGA